jgi:ubiquinone/menaquinone biosynthesis C-methylase UbiE
MKKWVQGQKFWRKAAIIATGVLTLILGFAAFYRYEHTYVWFSEGLPSSSEVATWSEEERFNRLYKLSRWENFISGVQFNRFVRDQIDPLGMNKTTQFHFLEIGVGVGAFALEVLKLYPYSSGEGIDVVPGAIAIAETVLPKERMVVQVGDMCDLRSMRGSEFDVVYVPGAVCYLLSLGDVETAVAEFYRVLRPGGGLCLSMIASDTSDMGSCNTRIPKDFWTRDMVYRYGFRVLRVDEMDDWHLPHSSGRYSVCLRK